MRASDENERSQMLNLGSWLKIQLLAISCYWRQVEGVIRLRPGLFLHAIPFFRSFLFWLLDIKGMLRCSELLACLGFITA